MINKENNMHAKVIQAMKDKGWTLEIISLRSQISCNRLINGSLGIKEIRRLEEVACRDAGLDIDEIYGE